MLIGKASGRRSAQIEGKRHGATRNVLGGSTIHERGSGQCKKAKGGGSAPCYSAALQQMARFPGGAAKEIARDATSNVLGGAKRHEKGSHKANGRGSGQCYRATHAVNKRQRRWAVP